MSGAIHDLSAVRLGARLDADVCVIGSGPGGATAAWDLAQAGLEVIVLDEGADFSGADIGRGEMERQQRFYADRAARASRDLGVSVLAGRALGGGSVINASDVVPIPDGVLRCWSRRHGLSSWGPEELAPFRERALADLSANRPGEELLNANNRLLRAGADALGWRGEIMLHNRVGCAGLGNCLIGCPAGAKRNARTVALAEAVAAGATVLARARATQIEGATGSIKTVQVRALDAEGNHERGSLVVRAPVVMLAANAVGTAALLLRSGIGNAHVGRHLSLQPQLPVCAIFPDQVRGFRGIPQSFAITEFEDLDHDEHGWWGLRIESIGGTPGMVASLLPAVGPEGKAWMSRYAHLAAALVLVPDAPSGSVTVEPSGRVRIDWTPDPSVVRRLRAGARAAARAFLAAGAREVIAPISPAVIMRSERDLAQLEQMPVRPASAPLISAHQQGTVRMASSERLGAADPDGRVYGARDVLVCDSSIYPTSASSHVMAPIVTTSHLLAARLLARRPA